MSTEDQSLDRQLTPTQEYARNRLDVDLADIHVYRDKSTGTDTERSGYIRTDGVPTEQRPSAQNVLFALRALLDR